MNPLPVFSLILVCLMPADASAPVTIAVRPASEVAAARFTIGDIAVVSGADRSLLLRIRAIEAGVSPLPGLSRGIATADILARLRYARIDTRSIAVSCPPVARITRTAREAPADEILRAAIGALGDLSGATVEPAQPLPHVMVPPGKLEYRPGAPRSQPGAATVIVPVTVLADGKPARTIDVALRLHRKVSALVARRALDAHAAIGPDDVVLDQIELPPGTPTALADISALAGKRAVHRIPQGAPITAEMVETAPVITYGARITVEIVAGGVHISAPAVAHGSGAPGDTIRVLAMETRRELTGVIVDASTVRVDQ